MDAFFFITYISGMVFVVWLITLIYKKSSTTSPSFTSFTPPAPDGVLPNGYTRRNYRAAGNPNTAIDMWRLDQPHAPDSYSAGFVIGDLSDGKFDL